ncbi:8116_t:CDS:2 [Entrophospora sp. SA101]|nr:8116_t:CDS:2 [Entrophospora sp. SA101]CAJ0886607.1 12143_t:CDS:2 [Entrophospora sp. SA101]
MSNNISLTSLSLTHVEFDPTDSIAYIFAYITLSPLAIMVAYVTIIVSRREVAGINIFIGQSICELFNAILKRWLREKRPTDKLGTGYGMPSSHAQFIAFFAIFAILYLYNRNNKWKFPIACFLIIFSILVSYSRIYLNYHTTKQVLFGNLFGSIFALVWYIIIELLIRPLGFYKYLINTDLARSFYLRDSALVPDVLRFEYIFWVKFKDYKEI